MEPPSQKRLSRWPFVDRPIALVGAVSGTDDNERFRGVGCNGAQSRFKLSRKEFVEGLSALRGLDVGTHVI